MAKVKIVKNKISAPFKTAEIPVKRGFGYDHDMDIIEASLILKLISRAGAFYTI
jgi:recombination protein RecA